MAERHGAVDDLKASIQALECTIYGNGGPGLKTEVRVIEQRMNDAIVELRTQSERQRQSEKLIAYAIGGLYVLSVLSALFVKFWK